MREEREGKKEKRESKPKDLFSLYLSVRCSLWWKQDETPWQGRREAEMWGRNLYAEGTAGSTAVVERGELLTERNGRRVREQHRRQKVFRKEKKKKKESDKEEKRERVKYWL